MYSPKEKVFWFSVTSRLAVIALQFVFNVLCPDHEADAFRSPRDSSEFVSIFDRAVDTLLGGLTRWDAQYFMHIAKYGYTYENTLAFFPLYPMAVRCVAAVLKIVLFMANQHSLTTISAVLINFVCFVKSAVIFYNLSERVLGRKSLAYKASILYCINPASIFFTAGYSESMFAYLTFSSMLVSLSDLRFVHFPIGLSALVRSNGLINIGFPVYEWLVQNIFLRTSSVIVRGWNTRTIVNKLALVFIDATLSSLRILTCVFLSLVPYILLQVYNYVLFCTEYSREVSLPAHLERYARENNLTIAGDGGVDWCASSLPLAYSTIQQKYWNVGFIRYYEFKQIPNFLLALPILFIMLRCSYRYFSDNARLLLSFFGRRREEDAPIARPNRLPLGMFVFIVHGLFLTLFSILFVHIQVSTRLLASASPLLYWYCANVMSYEPAGNDNSSSNYEEFENKFSQWKVFFMNQKHYTLADKCILSYFLGYLVVGCFMYSNFLPWT